MQVIEKTMDRYLLSIALIIGGSLICLGSFGYVTTSPYIEKSISDWPWFLKAIILVSFVLSVSGGVLLFFTVRRDMFERKVFGGLNTYFRGNISDGDFAKLEDIYKKHPSELKSLSDVLQKHGSFEKRLCGTEMQDKIEDFLETYSKQTTPESQLTKVEGLTETIQNCLKQESPVDRLKKLCKAIPIDTDNCGALEKVYLQDQENFEKLAWWLKEDSTLRCDKEELVQNIQEEIVKQNLKASAKQKLDATSINGMIGRCLKGSKAAATTTAHAETDNLSFMSAM